MLTQKAMMGVDIDTKIPYVVSYKFKRGVGYERQSVTERGRKREGEVRLCAGLAIKFKDSYR